LQYRDSGYAKENQLIISNLINIFVMLSLELVYPFINLSFLTINEDASVMLPPKHGIAYPIAGEQKKHCQYSCRQAYEDDHG